MIKMDDNWGSPDVFRSPSPHGPWTLGTHTGTVGSPHHVLRTKTATEHNVLTLLISEVSPGMKSSNIFIYIYILVYIMHIYIY